jgi:hypothetical protein
MSRLFLACCLATLLAGCGDKAKDLYETAQLEEKQFNKPHATELYRQIVEQYPNSPYASQVNNRLAELKALIREGVRGGCECRNGAIVPPIRSPIACAPRRRPGP